MSQPTTFPSSGITRAQAREEYPVNTPENKKVLLRDHKRRSLFAGVGELPPSTPLLQSCLGGGVPPTSSYATGLIGGIPSAKGLSGGTPSAIGLTWECPPPTQERTRYQRPGTRDQGVPPPVNRQIENITFHLTLYAGDNSRCERE